MQPVNRSRSERMSGEGLGSFFYSCFVKPSFLLLENRNDLVYSRRCMTRPPPTPANEPHARSSREDAVRVSRNAQTGIPRRATLDILATILGISRYGYRYCTLYVSSFGEGKTPRGRATANEREARWCAPLCLSGGSEP